MQANTSKRVQRAVTILPLALFFTANPLLAAAQNSHVNGLPSAWRAYAADRLAGTPVALQHITGNSIRRAVAQNVNAWQVTVSTSADGKTALSLSAAFEVPRGRHSRIINDSVGGLSETQLVSAWTQRLGTDAELSFNGVFAHQTFATPELMETTYSVDVPRQNWSSAWEHSTGAGLGLTVVQPLNAMVDFRFAAQTRIEMEAFERFRGVFSDPGRFDIPSSLRAGLDLRVSNQHLIGFGVDRVAYGDVQPFTSQDLPDRFLSLLGDGTSPTFEWRDLTVYSVRWQWQPDALTQVELRYSTRLQPEPTSSVLRNALSTEYTDRNFGLSLVRSVGKSSELNFTASYSPYAYFLGPSLYRREADSGNQIEMEAVYRLNF